MTHSVLIALIGIAAVITLWMRRAAWRRRWETYGTIAVIAFSVGPALMSELSVRTLGAALHRLTGLWHLDDYLAHVCFLLGAVAVTGFAMARLVGEENTKRRIWRQVITPAATAAFAMLIVFTHSNLSHARVADLVTDTHPDTWGIAYSAIFTTAMIYILARAATLTLTLWTDRRSTTVASLLLACITGWAIASAAMLLQAIPATHHFWATTAWLIGTTTDIAFAATLAISWHRQPKHTTTN